MITTHILLYLVLLFAAVLSYLFHKLTLTGAITGWIIGVIIALGTGYLGISELAAFFILSSLATQTKGERRTAGQVIANGGAAAILSLLAIVFRQNVSVLQLMLAGSMASATADTLSSELGTLYGKKFFNIIDFKADQKGLDGVISLEGTLIGIIGAVIIAGVYCFFNGWSILFVFVVIAGFIGNISDSILGAAFERKGIISNNAVNFLNTVIGAMICCCFVCRTNDLHFLNIK